MNVPTRDYDRCFEGAELQRIRSLRKLDEYRQFYGLLLALGTFFVSLGASVLMGFLWKVDHLWVTGFWLGLLASVALGVWLPFYIDARIEREFRTKWDPLFLERTPLSLSQIAAREEIIRLTDSHHWYGLSEEQQRSKVKEVNRKHGLE
jgi:hypothetical protein